MGLLDYYRQFEALTEDEVNEELREQAAERRAKALARVETLDLSTTTSWELAHPRIVQWITYVARRGLQHYPHTRGSELRSELATRLGVEPARVILGNGAGDLLSSATRALIAPGEQLLTSWPSYPLYPIMARRAHGQAVPVKGGVDSLLAAAADPEVRVIALASPNDPTGELLATNSLEHLLDGLPERVAVLLDESLVEFADTQPVNSSIALLERYPRLFVFRSFSKAWGLAGLRVGYAIGGPGSERLFEELAPDLGVSELSQAGAFAALRACSEIVEQRVRAICEERPLLTAALSDRGLEVSDSQANFLWAAHPVLEGGELAALLARAGVLVAEGAALGEHRHVRIAIRGAAASGRLIEALDKSL